MIANPKPVRSAGGFLSSTEQAQRFFAHRTLTTLSFGKRVQANVVSYGFVDPLLEFSKQDSD